MGASPPRVLEPGLGCGRKELKREEQSTMGGGLYEDGSASGKFLFLERHWRGKRTRKRNSDPFRGRRCQPGLASAKPLNPVVMALHPISEGFLEEGEGLVALGWGPPCLPRTEDASLD